MIGADFHAVLQVDSAHLAAGRFQIHKAVVRAVQRIAPRVEARDQRRPAAGEAHRRPGIKGRVIVDPLQGQGQITAAVVDVATQQQPRLAAVIGAVIDLPDAVAAAKVAADGEAPGLQPRQGTAVEGIEARVAVVGKHQAHLAFLLARLAADEIHRGRRALGREYPRGPAEDGLDALVGEILADFKLAQKRRVGDGQAVFLQADKGVEAGARAPRRQGIVRLPAPGLGPQAGHGVEQVVNAQRRLLAHGVGVDDRHAVRGLQRRASLGSRAGHDHLFQQRTRPGLRRLGRGAVAGKRQQHRQQGRREWVAEGSDTPMSAPLHGHYLAESIYIQTLCVNKNAVKRLLIGSRHAVVAARGW